MIARGRFQVSDFFALRRERRFNAEAQRRRGAEKMGWVALALWLGLAGSGWGQTSISALPTATNLMSTNLIPVVTGPGQATGTRKATLGDLQLFMRQPGSQSINLSGSLTNFNAACARGDKLRLMWMGDSIGAETMPSVIQLLKELTPNGIDGGSPFLGYPYQWGTLSAAPPVTNTAQVYGVGWWGNNYILTNSATNGGTYTHGGPSGGGYYTADRLSVWYVQGSGYGTLKVEVTANMTDWTTVGQINCNGLGGMMVTNYALIRGAYAARFTNSTGGIVVLPAGATTFLDSQNQGATVMPCNAYGRTLDDFLAFGTTPIIRLFTNLNPHLLIWHSLKHQDTRTNWYTIKTILQTYCPTTDVAFVGLHPTAADTFDISQTVANSDRTVALTNGWPYVDLLTEIGQWKNVVSNGWSDDGTHFNTRGQKWKGDETIRQLGLATYLARGFRGSEDNNYATVSNVMWTNLQFQVPASMSLNLAGCLTNFAEACRTGQKLKIAWLGDGTGSETVASVIRLLNTWTDGGIDPGSAFYGYPYQWGPLSSPSAQMYGVGWWGMCYVLTNTAYYTIGGPGPSGSGYHYADRITLWYTKNLGYGTLKVQASTNGTDWSNLLTLNCNGTAGVYSTNITLAARPYMARITNEGAGIVSIPAPGMSLWHTTNTGARVHVLTSSQGTMDSFMAMGDATISRLLEELNPNLLIFQSFGTPASRTNWSHLKEIMATYAPTTDVAIVSVRPRASATAAELREVFMADRMVAQTNGWPFVDLMSGAGTYSNVLESGWNSDGLHYNTAGQKWEGDEFIRQLRLESYLNQASPLAGDYQPASANLTTLAGLDAAGLTNLPLASLNFADLVADVAFTSQVCGYLKFTNGGKVYSIVVSTNLP